jgi:hypothetical protein
MMATTTTAPTDFVGKFLAGLQGLIAKGQADAVADLKAAAADATANGNTVYATAWNYLADYVAGLKIPQLGGPIVGPAQIMQQIADLNQLITTGGSPAFKAAVYPMLLDIQQSIAKGGIEAAGGAALATVLGPLAPLVGL